MGELATNCHFGRQKIKGIAGIRCMAWGEKENALHDVCVGALPCKAFDEVGGANREVMCAVKVVFLQRVKIPSGSYRSSR